MNEPSAVQEEVARIRSMADEAGSDREALLAVLDETARLHKPVEVWRETQRDLVERAYLAGAQPTDLVGKTTYTDSYLRAIYNEMRVAGADLPVLRRGPRKRQPRT